MTVKQPDYYERDDITLAGLLVIALISLCVGLVLGILIT
jgi:hypothetical protein